MKFKHLSLLFLLAALSACNTPEEKAIVNLKVGPQPDGSILVPSNQLLRPAGLQIDLPGRPVDLALTPDGRYLLVKNKADLDLVRLSDRTLMQTLPFQHGGASFTGLCLSPDGKKVYVTDSENRVCVAALDGNNSMHWEEPIVLPSDGSGFPFPGGLAFSGESKLLVTLSRNNTLAVIALPGKKINQIPVGVAPYDVVLKDDSKAYVTNWGGRQTKEGESVYKSSGTPALVDPETGIASSGTVSVIDLSKNEQVKSIEVGLHPSGMALSPNKDRLYVACANSDLIFVIDTKTDEVVEKISVHEEGSLFGSSPNDVVVSPDGKTLLVANGTDNAICVIGLGIASKIEGYIPTAWYPGTVLASGDGKTLYVANIKGTGSRNNRADKKGFNSHDHLGSLSIIPIPDRNLLDQMTGIVASNNSLSSFYGNKDSKFTGNKTTPVPVVPGQKSVFRHVVYIIKENRTYDQVFGDFKQANGDSSLVMFGREVTPNQHLLAETFVLLDNFYCSGVLSADGHQWTDEAIVTDYLEKSFGGFTRSYPYDGDDPLAYASSGFIWDNVLRHNLTFRNYGEFVNAVIEPANATFSEIFQDYLSKSGKISIRAKANLDQLAPYLCPTYVGFPNTVSDQYRADEFIRELHEYEKNDSFPNFIIMLLPNNHTSGTRPGMPVPQAAVADNDLALGRIVEAISSSKFWKETCILVTEDDPQNGFDHVDGHRTVGMVISPYTRRGEVVSAYYSQINMVRTIENILGLPPMNQLDMSAEAMTECFTDKPDFTPYKAVPNNIPLDRLNPELNSLTGDALYWAGKSLEQDLDDVDRIDDDTFNRILWHAVRGYDTPYPEMLK
ncbi:MAG TPA: bifunctional YncE family protein/alkaline phosphatase family protein [Bacteroidales bacterium]|nr:bifunctional YncE family protein/alkaline phosphatase family protein [Bacteroidales bacterium]